MPQSIYTAKPVVAVVIALAVCTVLAILVLGVRP